MEDVVSSKISIQYMVRIPASILLFSFFAYAIIRANMGDPYNPANDIAFKQRVFFSIVIIVIVVTVVGLLLRPQKISISAYGILFYGNIIKRQHRIVFEDIAGVSISNQNRSINTAARSTSQLLRIELKNGKDFYLSNSEYENYDDLKAALYTHLRDGHYPLQ
jgi:hypothetical protein